MADHMQDEADLEALKRWWDENGKGIVAAVVVAVLGTVGWQGRKLVCITILFFELDS